MENSNSKDAKQRQATIEASPLLNAVPFTLADVEDVRVIIIAHGKHYGIVPNENNCTREESKEIRIGLLSLLLDFHFVVDRALEDLSGHGI